MIKFKITYLKYKIKFMITFLFFNILLFNYKFI